MDDGRAPPTRPIVGRRHSDDPEDIGKVLRTFKDVQLHAARLGLTLENVLEATVVHGVDETARLMKLVSWPTTVVSVNSETTAIARRSHHFIENADRPLELKVQDLGGNSARRRKEARGLALAARQPPACPR